MNEPSGNNCCQYIFLRGENKGKQCPVKKSQVIDGPVKREYCMKHYKLELQRVKKALVVPLPKTLECSIIPPPFSSSGSLSSGASATSFRPRLVMMPATKFEDDPNIEIIKLPPITVPRLPQQPKVADEVQGKSLLS